MKLDTDFGLDAVASREVKKLYFVLLRIVEEDAFMTQEDADFHAERLFRVFLSSSKLYEKGNHTALDLKEDFTSLFNKLTEASIHDEYYEKTANLTRVKSGFDRLFDRYCQRLTARALSEAASSQA